MNPGVDAHAVLAIMRTRLFRDLVYSKGRGSTPSRYRVTRRDFLNLPFPILDNIQKELADDMMARIAKVLELEEEAKLLWA